MQFLAAQYLVDVQQDFHFALYLRHAEQAGCVPAVAEVRRVFNIGPRQVESFANSGSLNLNHNDAGPLRVGGRPVMASFRRVRNDLKIQYAGVPSVKISGVVPQLGKKCIRLLVGQRLHFDEYELLQVGR
jgi:hypothetical protein